MTSADQPAWTPPGPAIRVDDSAAFEDQVGFIGPAGDRLFMCLHRPNRSVKGCVIVCSSIHAEQVANYRREVLLGRALATRGLITARFHYRGSGNSERETEELTFESMVADARYVATFVQTEVKGSPVGWVGTRLGAMVASASSDAGPIALWEPVIRGRDFFREVFRMRAMREVSDTTRSSSTPVEEIEQKGSADILGYPISKALYEGTNDLELNIGPERPLLLAQLSKGSSLKPAYARWSENVGREVVTEVIDQEEAWWFPRIPHVAEETLPGTRTLIERTASWLERELSGGNRS